MAPNTPATENLRVNQVVNEDTKQVVIRGKITVPDPKPDVEKILSVNKTATIKNIKIVPDKAIVEGVLTLQIVYVAFEPAQAVHHMHDRLKFTTYVDVPGVEPGMDVLGKVTIEDVNITRSRDDVRQFDVAAVLSVFIKVTEIQEVDVLIECPAGATCETETIKVSHLIQDETKQVIVSEDFYVPDKKPAIEKILDTKVTAEISNIKVLKNKVIVDGNVVLDVIYVAMERDQPVHQMHTSFSFSDFIEVPGVETGMDVFVDVDVESSDVEEVTPNRLRADVVMKLTAYVYEYRQVNVITEVAGAKATMVTLKLDHIVGENCTQVVLRDVFETPAPKPSVEKFLDITTEKVEIVETKILKNKVIIRGDVFIQVVYVAFQPDQAVHALHRKIPFRTFVEVPGAMEGMDVEASGNVEFTAAEDKASNIIIELVLKVCARVKETMQKDVAVEVEAPPEEVCVPGEIVQHTIVAGDTLFALAQKYGTTVEAIMQANPGISPENLRVGQVISIPCGPAKG